MTETSPITDIGTAVSDESFPEVDMALRRGRHIDRDDAEWYAFLLDAQRVLESFYQRYGCELIHKSDGYFYLLPTGDQFGKRLLSPAEMLVGQALALLYLDPKTTESGGMVTRDDVLGHMASVMTTDGLMLAFNPKKRRLDERIAQETVRTKVAEAVRRLSNIGFVQLVAPDQIRLRAALMRFADPVRAEESPAEALAKLVAKGEVVLESVQESDLSEHAGAAPASAADEYDSVPDAHSLANSSEEDGAGTIEGDDADADADADADSDAYRELAEQEPSEPEAESELEVDPREKLEQRLAEFDDGGDEFDQAGLAFDPDKPGA